MATVNNQALAAFGTPIGISGLFHQFGTMLAARRRQSAQRARVRRELESFSDRELNDLGIGRGDIEAVVSGRYTR